MEAVPLLGIILLFTLLGSVVSLIGGIILLFKEKLAVKISRFLASFAAGALLGTAFFDLLPEALHLGEESEINIFTWTLMGILFFFLIERFIRWFHHHHYRHHSEFETDYSKPTVPLIVLGDSLHNFIDGIAIAATFMTDPALGVVTTLAVAAHEIPQEVGDFGILLHRGVKRSKVLLYNVISALTAVLGAVITYYLGDTVQSLVPLVLALTAGFFIYIAASDLIPEIHHREWKEYSYLESALLLVGVLTIFLTTILLEH